jgi:hypothetical protein
MDHSKLSYRSTHFRSLSGFVFLFDAFLFASLTQDWTAQIFGRDARNTVVLQNRRGNSHGVRLPVSGSSGRPTIIFSPSSPLNARSVQPYFDHHAEIHSGARFDQLNTVSLSHFPWFSFWLASIDFCSPTPAFTQELKQKVNRASCMVHHNRDFFGETVDIIHVQLPRSSAPNDYLVVLFSPCTANSKLSRIISQFGPGYELGTAT